MAARSNSRIPSAKRLLLRARDKPIIEENFAACNRKGGCTIQTCDMAGEIPFFSLPKTSAVFSPKWIALKSGKHDVAWQAPQANISLT